MNSTSIFEGLPRKLPGDIREEARGSYESLDDGEFACIKFRVSGVYDIEPFKFFMPKSKFEFLSEEF